MDGRRADVGGRGALAAAALAALLACNAGERWETVEIAAPDADLARAEGPPRDATLAASGRRRPVTLAPVAEGSAAAAFAVRAVPDGEALGRLLLGGDAAALLYHLASRDDGLANELLQRNQLALVDARGGRRLGLLLAAQAPPPGVAGVAELAPADAARVVALAQALGAWDVVARNQYALRADGTPVLPFFEPAAPGDWRVLSRRSLAAFLPASLGRFFLAAEGFRSQRDRALARAAARLPALAAAARDFAASGAAPGASESIAALAEATDEAGRALSGYLDSIWLELLVRGEPPDAARITLDVYGVTDVRLDALELTVPRPLLLLGGRAYAGLRLLPDGGDPIAGRLRRTKVVFPLAAELPPRPDGPTRFFGVRRSYRLVGLAGLDDAYWPTLAGATLRATNRATGRAVDASHVARSVSHDDPRFDAPRDGDVAAWLAREAQVLARDGGGDGLVLDPDGGRLRLSAGSYHLRGDLLLPASLGLVLEAGVELRVDPGCSLLVRGPLEVRGSAARPVRVRAADPGAPWGVLAVQGRGRSELPERPRAASVVRHLELSGGSEDHLAGVRYTGQLSVHHQDLRLQHALLRGAWGDDALNAKHARVEVLVSRFEDNAGDALDLDFCDASVTGSRFRGGAGDGLDLSGGRAVVADSVFDGFGDKCVSAGEATQVEIVGSLLRGCALGLASKDSSDASVAQSALVDNGVDFAAYQKKAMFGGGHIAADGVLSAGAGGDDRCDAGSTLSVTRRRSDGGAEAGALAARLRALPDFSRARYRELSAGAP